MTIKLQDAFELAAGMYKVQQTEWMRLLAEISTLVECDMTSGFLAALAQRIDIALKQEQTFVMSVDEATILKEFFDRNQHSEMVQFLDYSMGDAIEEALA
ncbi:hypothetical protein AB6C66_22520 [Vibrio splendidus]|uniref:hypothetical protein n=1 Tax=Vibrio splendidus TaxID=29497 RepID=UPI00031E60D6|nr:hypothetical protein [Vibrio splendidus]OEF83309.1 hypothetical protein A148_25385 [Vibrio splendidus 1F-157]PTP70883.1 hypothetical protein CWO23_10775 [Vibrio splendidus]